MLIDAGLIVVALFCSILYSISTYFQLQYGMGYHYWEIKEKSIYAGYYIVSFLPVAITNNLATLFTKASILVFYLRFSVSKRFNTAVYFVLSVVVAYTLMGAFSFLYACQPMIRTWVPSTPGTCINVNAWYGTLVSLNVLTDLVLLLLPFWILKPLRVCFAQKAAIAAVLGAGSFVLGVSVYRLFLTVTYRGDKDFPHRLAVNYLWLIIEVNVALICACLPCLRSLVGRYMPSLMVTPRQTPPRLRTIPVTERIRDTRMTRATVEHFDVVVNKPDTPGTMWIESRASSVFFAPEPRYCDIDSERADSPSVYSTMTRATSPTCSMTPISPLKPSPTYTREGFI
jgi:hypothetical protein